MAWTRGRRGPLGTAEAEMHNALPRNNRGGGNRCAHPLGKARGVPPAPRLANTARPRPRGGGPALLLPESPLATAPQGLGSIQRRHLAGVCLRVLRLPKDINHSGGTLAFSRKKKGTPVGGALESAEPFSKVTASLESHPLFRRIKTYSSVPQFPSL